jgi:hypothetical protein
MANAKAHFELVPVTVAKRIAERESVMRRPPRISCAICECPVELEQCKTDENGDAVHADCYLAKVTRTIRPLARRSKSKQQGEVQRL